MKSKGLVNAKVHAVRGTGGGATGAVGRWGDGRRGYRGRGEQG